MAVTVPEAMTNHDRDCLGDRDLAVGDRDGDCDRDREYDCDRDDCDCDSDFQ